MKRFSLFMFATAACVHAATAFAGGAVDKVTGDFTQGSCCLPDGQLRAVTHRLISAHEESDKHPQAGFLLSWGDDGVWFEMDFSDAANTCVKVYADGQARIGGLVSDGNGPQVGRYFGIYLADAGEPAYFVDHGVNHRMSLDYYSEETRLAFLDWCATGELPGLEGQTVWPFVIFQGNLQIHNSPGDGD